MVVMKIMMMTTLSSMMNSTKALHRAEAPGPGGARQELPPPDAANTSTWDLVQAGGTSEAYSIAMWYR